MMREIATWLSDSRVDNSSVVDHSNRLCDCVDSTLSTFSWILGNPE